MCPTSRAFLMCKSWRQRWDWYINCCKRLLSLVNAAPPLQSMQRLIAVVWVRFRCVIRQASSPGAVCCLQVAKGPYVSRTMTNGITIQDGSSAEAPQQVCQCVCCGVKCALAPLRCGGLFLERFKGVPCLVQFAVHFDGHTQITLMWLGNSAIGKALPYVPYVCETCAQKSSGDARADALAEADEDMARRLQSKMDAQVSSSGVCRELQSLRQAERSHAMLCAMLSSACCPSACIVPSRPRILQERNVAPLSGLVLTSAHEFYFLSSISVFDTNQTHPQD